MSEVLSSDYFAIVPEFVITADISANAVRLYAILNRFANSQGKAWPSRKTLADIMRTSTATIDRAKEELIAIHALSVEHRINPAGDPSSNLYTLHTRSVDNQEKSSPVRRGSPKVGGTGSPKDDALNRASMNQSHLGDSSLKTCPTCLNKNRAGYDDPVEENKSHIWNAKSKTYILCPKCHGQGNIKK